MRGGEAWRHSISSTASSVISLVGFILRSLRFDAFPPSGVDRGRLFALSLGCCLEWGCQCAMMACCSLARGELVWYAFFGGLRLNRPATVTSVALRSPGPTGSSYRDVREPDEVDRVLEVVEVDCSLHGHQRTYQLFHVVM